MADWLNAVVEALDEELKAVPRGRVVRETEIDAHTIEPVPVYSIYNLIDHVQ